ncbi:MAG: HAMP domain-containing sensor histidine kinase [Sterolibacterium sp.]|nr:HAMP domain-containing sensor histidine kinase [Sterolibacterium sp.]
MDFISWFVPPNVLDDPRKNTRHRGIAKSLLTISLVTLLVFFGYLLARGKLPAADYALFAAAIGTPTLGALLIRATGDITLGLVTTNIGGILIVAVWAFLTGGIDSMALPAFLANIALLSTFGNTAILLIMGTAMMAVLVFLYLATSMGWLPVSLIPAAEMPALMLTSMLGSVGLVVLAGVVVARDRAIAKAHLRTAQHAAEQSSRAKSVFLTSMSAELRTPLNTILGFAELLHANEAKTLNVEQLSSIEHISAAGEYLLGLVTQVLEMSRIDEGELKLNMEPLRAEQIIVPCLAMIELEARKRGIALVNDCGARAGWIVWTDRLLVKQVLLNLLSNAVKFNRDGGTVTVSCQPDGAEFLRISVTDTGSGVASDRQGELFEPFIRLGVDAGRLQGAGLGLAIAKRLTERMRGRIGYASTEGTGSTFWVALPLAEAHAT